MDVDVCALYLCKSVKVNGLAVNYSKIYDAIQCQIHICELK